MVIQTVLDRFREGRRLNVAELNELLEGEPGLQGDVVASLSDRYLTRRSLRQLIEQVPGLRVDLGRRLLAQEPRVLDALEVIQDVPELRELGLQALRTGEFSPTKILRVARRNPRLREAAIDAVLSEDRTRERLLEVIRRLPGSEDLLVERLEALGLPPSDLEAVLAAVPELRGESGTTRGPRSQDWRVAPERQPQLARDAQRGRDAGRGRDTGRGRDVGDPRDGGRPRDVGRSRDVGRPRDAQPDRGGPSVAVAEPVDEPPLEVADQQESGEPTPDLLPGHERHRRSSVKPSPPTAAGDEPALASAEPTPAEEPTSEPAPAGRPDPWRDTEAPPIDELDRRWGRGRQP